MEHIIKSYGIPTKIINDIMLLYIDTKSMVRSPDGDTEYLYINEGVLRGGYSGAIIIYYYTRLCIKNVY